jgi:hypothetical protein
VEAIIAAQVGEIDKAVRYGMAALLMDLADDPETKGSCTSPTRGSSKTHMPWCLYGEITLMAFMRYGRAAAPLLSSDGRRRA